MPHCFVQKRGALAKKIYYEKVFAFTCRLFPIALFVLIFRNGYIRKLPWLAQGLG